MHDDMFLHIWNYLFFSSRQVSQSGIYLQLVGVYLSVERGSLLVIQSYLSGIFVQWNIGSFLKVLVFEEIQWLILIYFHLIKLHLVKSTFIAL